MCGILIKLFASLRKSIHRPKLTTTQALENESFLGNFTAKAKSDIPSPFGSLQHKIPIQEHSLCRVILHIRSFLCLTRREINKSEKKAFRKSSLQSRERNCRCSAESLPASGATRRWSWENERIFRIIRLLIT